MNYIHINLTKILIIFGVFITALFFSFIIFHNQAFAQFYPAEVREVRNTLSSDQNSVTIFVRGFGACLDSIDPNTFCARSEYVDVEINLVVQRIVNNAYASDQWNGNLYYSAGTTNIIFPGSPNPAQIAPAGFNGIINTASWPSGIYRFCATISGSITAQWPDDVYASQSRCAPTFTIVRPEFTGLTCGTDQSVDLGTTASYLIAAQGAPASPISVTMSSNPAGPVMSNSPLILNSGNSYTGIATVPTNGLGVGYYVLTFNGTDGTTNLQCQANLTVLDRGYVDLKFDGSDGPTTPTPPDGSSGVLSWQTRGNINYCTPSMAQGDVPSWTDLGTLPPNGNATVTKLQNGQTYIFRIECVTMGGTPTPPDTVEVQVGAVQMPTATLQCLGVEGKAPSAGPCEVPYNSSVQLSWTSAYTNSCSIGPGTWSTATSGTQNSPNLTSNVTYTLICYGPGGATAPSSVQVNVISNQNYTFALSSYNDVQPQGNMSSTNLLVLNPVDGFNSPVNMSVVGVSPSGLPIGNINITGSPVNYPYGSSAVAQIATAGVTPGQYTITFRSNGGTANDPKQLDFVLSVIAAIAPQPPQNPTVTQGTCGQVVVSWNSHASHNSSIEYRVYRRLSGAATWGDAIAVIPYTVSGAYSYQDNNIPAGSYEYRISASVGSTGSPAYTAVLGPIVPIPCTASLSGTYKRIVGTGSAPSAYAPCGSSSSIQLPNGLIYKAGDTVFFEICVRSSGTLALTNVVITENLGKSLNIENVQLVSSSADCVSGNGSGPYIVSIRGNRSGVMNPGQTCSVLISATLKDPGGPASTLHRFTNYARVGASEVSTDVNTLPELFSVGGGVPTRAETAP